MEKNTSDETDFMEKNMTRVTPTSELDNGITTWLLYSSSYSNWGHYPDYSVDYLTACDSMFYKTQ